ncbi:hypothetical protein UFOVP891_48 [uncultured Caudovirales phage]|uniref:Uncharacterized protein n=1 Tax=uncultured Caudovirales phage TaxID=2100421 RepID=A0A6J5Q900_9CAUD|nr:hypothetical protein UFOVP472_19 [uncultured Caudovirales phage]CAB4169189.1 hypothetical protein UFOVP891_48 [uncultured Caudovirales phage]CAB4180759.1 hypothetical protein UFOVP1053_19 [uncultured Caudovirales phage]CAB4196064.1 hypothetical protein UFOVP1297_54 [uncultured Caudovirales phage]CAB4221896.1 hypothetical protein UFOVP1647_32 [uncultured Caudovirales phage]
MTYLEMCQRLMVEASISGTMSTVAGNAGLMGKAVGWINTAYVDIQNLHQDWEWMRREARLNTVAATREYAYTSFTDSSVAISRFRRWVPETFSYWLSSTGQSGEGFMDEVDYAVWRRAYDFGSRATQQGAPINYAVKPNKSIAIYPVPDAVYVVRGDYYRSAVNLTLDADTPEFHSDYHMAIVWAALMLYGEERSAPECYAQGISHYNEVISKLERDQLPGIQFGGPLA